MQSFHLLGWSWMIIDAIEFFPFFYIYFGKIYLLFLTINIFGRSYFQCVCFTVIKLRMEKEVWGKFGWLRYIYKGRLFLGRAIQLIYINWTDKSSYYKNWCVCVYESNNKCLCFGIDFFLYLGILGLGPIGLLLQKVDAKY